MGLLRIQVAMPYACIVILAKTPQAHGNAGAALSSGN